MTVLRCVTLKVRPSRTHIIGELRNSGVELVGPGCKLEYAVITKVTNAMSHVTPLHRVTLTLSHNHCDNI